MTPPRRLPAAVRLLLALLPRAFRERFGPQLADAVRERHREEVVAGTTPAPWFWTATTLDLAGTVVVARLEAAGRTLALLPGELRRAGRGLLRRPGYLATAVLTLGLGLGGATAMAPVLRDVLLAPLPYADPGELVILFNDGRGARPDFDPWWPVSREQIERFSAEARSVTATTWIARQTTAPLVAEGVPEEVPVGVVADDFFTFLGVEAARGRLFAPGDDGSGEPVVVLGARAWRTRFGADPDIVGRTLELRGATRTVVGVLPDSFAWYGPEHAAPPEFWIAGVERETGFYDRWLLARLAPGRTPEDARLEFGPVAYERFTNDGMKDRIGPADAASVRTLRDHHLGPVQARIPFLAGAIALVLLLGTLSVSVLVLGRTAALEEALAIRRALGASRRRAAASVLAESGVVVALGTATGLLLGPWGLELARRMAPPGIARLEEARVDGVEALAVVGVAALVFVVVAALPTWFATRVTERPGALRRGRGITLGTERARRTLLGLQVGATVVLLLACSLLVRSWHALATEELGFRSEGVLVAQLDLPRDAWRPVVVPRAEPTAEDGDEARLVRADGELLARVDLLRERAAALPGVRSVGLARHAPLTGRYGGWSPLTVEGAEDRAWADQRHGTAANWVGPGYFETLGVRPLRGRLLRPSDSGEGAPPVAVVSASFVERFWPGRSGVGERFYAYPVQLDERGAARTGARLVEVVGVVPTMRERSLREDDVTAYLPWRPSVRLAYRADPELTLFLRADGDPALLAPALRSLAADLFPERPLRRLEPLEATAASWRRDTAFFASLATGFAAYGLLLALVGVVGVVTLQVRRRGREAGIRRALGATGRDIYWLLGRDLLVACGAGVAAGAGAAALGADLLEAWLYRVAPRDPLSFAGVPLLLLLATLLAGALATRGLVRGSPGRVLDED